MFCDLMCFYVTQSKTLILLYTHFRAIKFRIFMWITGKIELKNCGRRIFAVFKNMGCFLKIVQYVNFVEIKMFVISITYEI